jgi:TolB-like protein/DNA-binding winged helix-turn-helix (wHTH) protein/Flp pilus assembly protein TadD
MAPVANGREAYRVGDLIVDVGLQRVTGPSGDIVLPKLSFELLLALLQRAPDFVSNEELASLVWADVVVSPETVTKRVNLLREALGDHPASPRYIAGLRSRGYRIVAPVSREPVAPAQVSASLASAPLPAPAVSPTTGATARPGSRRILSGYRPAYIAVIAAGLIVTIAMAAWVGWNRGASKAPSTTVESAVSDATVAVLPFENLSPSPSDAYLAIGIPELILDRLSIVPGLTVIAGSSTSGFAGSASSPQEAGRRLGARYLVLGSAQRAGAQMRVTARLVDTLTGSQVWSTRLDRGVVDILSVQDTIATSVAEELRQRVQGVEPAPSRAQHVPPVEAQLAYLQARALLARYTVRGSEEAAAKFEQAVALDPQFAAARAGLYDARMLAAERRHDDLAAERKRLAPLIERTLAIDPDCGHALVVRAIWGDGDPADREADFRRGLELDPSDGRGLVAFSEFLDKQGRYDEAGRVLDRAMVVDPLSPRLHFRLVMRDFDRNGFRFRETGLKHVLEIDPDYQPALQRYGKTRWGLHGQMTEAAQLLEHAIEVDPDNPWSRQTAAAIYLDLGDLAAAREVADGTPSSRRTAQLLLALFQGDWRTAGEVALSPAGQEYNLAESWGAAEAVRDYALRTGDLRRGIAFFEDRYELDGADPALDITNFRAATYLAQLLQASGDDARARRLLDRLPQEIDATVPRFGAIYALRTKASVQLLSGDRAAALRTLGDSFAANDYLQWWYTLEHDPLWQPLHDDPTFKAVAAQVRAHVAVEQASLQELRRSERIASRGKKDPVGKS